MRKEPGYKQFQREILGLQTNFTFPVAQDSRFIVPILMAMGVPTEGYTDPNKQAQAQNLQGNEPQGEGDNAAAADNPTNPEGSTDINSAGIVLSPVRRRRRSGVRLTQKGPVPIVHNPQSEGEATHPPGGGPADAGEGTAPPAEAPRITDAAQIYDKLLKTIEWGPKTVRVELKQEGVTATVELRYTVGLETPPLSLVPSLFPQAKMKDFFAESGKGKQVVRAVYESELEGVPVTIHIVPEEIKDTPKPAAVEETPVFSQAENIVRHILAYYISRTGVGKPTDYQKMMEGVYYTPHGLTETEATAFLEGIKHQLDMPNTVLERTAANIGGENKIGFKYTVYSDKGEAQAALFVPLQELQPPSLLKQIGIGIIAGLASLFGISPSYWLERGSAGRRIIKAINDWMQKGGSGANFKLNTALNNIVKRVGSLQDIMSIAKETVKEIASVGVHPSLTSTALLGENGSPEVFAAQRLLLPMAYLAASQSPESSFVELSKLEAKEKALEAYQSAAEKVGMPKEFWKKLERAIEVAVSKLPSKEWVQLPAIDAPEEEALASVLGPIYQAGDSVFIVRPAVHHLVEAEALYLDKTDMPSAIIQAITSSRNTVEMNRVLTAGMTYLMGELFEKTGGAVHEVLAPHPLVVKEQSGEERYSWWGFSLKSPGPEDLGDADPADYEKAAEEWSRAREALIASLAPQAMRTSVSLATKLLFDENTGEKTVLGAVFEEETGKAIRSKADVQEAVKSLWADSAGTLAHKLGLISYGHPFANVSPVEGVQPDLVAALRSAFVWPMLQSRLMQVSEIPLLATLAVAGWLGSWRGPFVGREDTIAKVLAGQTAQFVLRHVPEEQRVQLLMKHMGISEAQAKELAQPAAFEEYVRLAAIYQTAVEKNKQWAGFLNALGEAWNMAVPIVAQKTGVTIESVFPGAGEGSSPSSAFLPTIKHYTNKYSQQLGAMKASLQTASERFTSVGAALTAAVADAAVQGIKSAYEMVETEKAYELPAIASNLNAKWWWERTASDVQQMYREANEKAGEGFAGKAAELLVRLSERVKANPAGLFEEALRGATPEEAELARISNEAKQVLKTVSTSVYGIDVQNPEGSIGVWPVLNAHPFGARYYLHTKVMGEPVKATAEILPIIEDPSASGVGFKVYEFAKAIHTSPRTWVRFGQAMPLDVHLGTTLFGEGRVTEDLFVSSTPYPDILSVESTESPGTLPAIGAKVPDYRTALQQVREATKARLNAYEFVLGIRGLQAGLPLAWVPEIHQQRLGWSEKKEAHFLERAATATAATNLVELAWGELPPEQAQHLEQLAETAAQAILSLEVPAGINQAWHHQAFLHRWVINQAQGSQQKVVESLYSVPPPAQGSKWSTWGLPPIISFKLREGQ